MKKLSIIAMVIALSGCAEVTKTLLPEPEIISANERYITLQDYVGFPGKVEQMAAAHCRQFGRIAQFQSKGGSGWQCDGRNSNLCSTFSCVQ